MELILQKKTSGFGLALSIDDVIVTLALLVLIQYHSVSRAGLIQSAALFQLSSPPLLFSSSLSLFSFSVPLPSFPFPPPPRREAAPLKPASGLA